MVHADKEKSEELAQLAYGLELGSYTFEKNKFKTKSKQKPIKQIDVVGKNASEAKKLFAKLS